MYSSRYSWYFPQPDTLPEMPPAKYRFVEIIGTA